MPTENKPRVFISYCTEDADWKDRLVTHIKVLEVEGELRVWHDGEIAAGDDRLATIEAELDAAAVAVFLISAHSLTSPFIREAQLRRLLKRRKENGLRIVPVLARPCAWPHVAWLADLQQRPGDGRALSGGTPHQVDTDLAAIATEIGDLLAQAPRYADAEAAALARELVEPAVRVASVREALRAALREDERSESAPARAEAKRVAPALTARADARAFLQALGVEPRTYAFDIVTVDTTGKERRRRKGGAEGYVEDLGGGVALEMIYIPGGTFLMGSADGDSQGFDDERPQHAVRVTEFAAGRFPVTQAQWRAVAGLPKVASDLNADPARFKGYDRPVERVGWHDAVEFCERLSARTGRPYRLPSEAEWEYAARAGSSSAFCFGDALTPELENFGNAYGGTTPVGHFGVANAFGLCDVHGNVLEWCQDHWHDDYHGAPADGRAWTEGGEATLRVLRGGYWIGNERDCRSADRLRGGPAEGSTPFGLRVMCAVSRTR